MGFREQISNADSYEKFKSVYKRMRAVHEEFDKESASVYPDQKKLNESAGSG